MTDEQDFDRLVRRFKRGKYVNPRRTAAVLSYVVAIAFYLVVVVVGNILLGPVLPRDPFWWRVTLTILVISIPAWLGFLYIQRFAQKAMEKAWIPYEIRLRDQHRNEYNLYKRATFQQRYTPARHNEPTPTFSEWLDKAGIPHE